MATEKLRIGIAGLRDGEGWAQRARLPRSAPSNAMSFSASPIRAWRLRRKRRPPSTSPRRSDRREMASHPDIDLVAVTVKALHHFELIKPVLDAGCEWPLGNGLTEAEALEAAARRAGVQTLVGLQAWSFPVRHLRDLIANGYVGEVLPTTLVGSGGAWGAEETARDAYLTTAAMGRTCFRYRLGIRSTRFVTASASSSMSTRPSPSAVTRSSETRLTATDDQVAIIGQLESGAVVTAHNRGGLSRGTNLLWEINSSEGDLQITAGNGHIQLSALTLRGARGDHRELKEIPTPPRYHLVRRRWSGERSIWAGPTSSLLGPRRGRSHFLTLRMRFGGAASWTISHSAGSGQHIDL
jgi:predicted dehydrogenase